MKCQGLDTGEVCDEGSKGINEQASYAATKLHQLYDKLEYKRQALGSIQNAPKPDKKVTNIGQCAKYSLLDHFSIEYQDVGMKWNQLQDV